MRVSVAVVGAGRMGSVVAAQLPEATRTIIIDSDAEKAQRLADRVGGRASDRLEAAGEAQMVFLVLPAPAVNDCAALLATVLPDGALLINMATTGRVDPAVIDANRHIAVIDARIIGHALSIAKGEPGIVVVGCDDERTVSRIRDQLPGFHRVVRGDAGQVARINRIASTEGLRAALTVRAKLTAMDLPAEWIDVAVRTVCAGTMRAYVDDDLGEFARRLARQLEEEMRPAAADAAAVDDPA